MAPLPFVSYRWMTVDGSGPACCAWWDSCCFWDSSCGFRVRCCGSCSGSCSGYCGGSCSASCRGCGSRSGSWVRCCGSGATTWTVPTGGVAGVAHEEPCGRRVACLGFGGHPLPAGSAVGFGRHGRAGGQLPPMSGYLLYLRGGQFPELVIEYGHLPLVLLYLAAAVTIILPDDGWYVARLLIRFSAIGLLLWFLR